MSAWPSAGASNRGRPARHISSKKERINTAPLSPLGQARSKREKRTSALFRDDGLFFKILHEEAFGLLDHRVALGFEFFADGLDAAWVLRVDLPVALERAPLGVMRLRPCCANSSAAYAATHEKIPVVIGQVK